MKVGPVVTFMGQPSHCSKRNEREEIFFVTASFFCMISKMHCPVLYYVVGFCWFLHWCPLPFAGNHCQFNDLIAFLLYQLLIFTLRKFWSQDLFFFYFLCSLTFCKPRACPVQWNVYAIVVWLRSLVRKFLRRQKCCWTPALTTLQCSKFLTVTLFLQH